MHKPQTVQRVAVWSRGVRLAHWLMAAGVLGLLATGYLLHRFPGQQAELDYHYLTGYLLVAGLAVRVYLLLFGRAEAHWRALMPDAGSGRAALAMLRFYLSLGRFPLPRWYAHNPLWGPIYLLIFGVLIAQVVTGLGVGEYWLAEEPALSWHTVGAQVILGFAILHILAVFLHDLYGTGSDCSAMINGHRTFSRPPLIGGLDALDARLRSLENRPSGPGDRGRQSTDTED